MFSLDSGSNEYVKTAKPKKARRDFEEALRIDPAFEQARRNLEGIRAQP